MIENEKCIHDSSQRQLKYCESDPFPIQTQALLRNNTLIIHEKHIDNRLLLKEHIISILYQLYLGVIFGYDLGESRIGISFLSNRVRA